MREEKGDLAQNLGVLMRFVQNWRLEGGEGGYGGDGGGIDVPKKGVVFCDFGLVFANKGGF